MVNVFLFDYILNCTFTGQPLQTAQFPTSPNGMVQIQNLQFLGQQGAVPLVQAPGGVQVLQSGAQPMIIVQVR